MPRSGVLELGFALAGIILRSDASECSVLKTLSFQQHDAPLGISGVVSTVTTLINEELEGVQDVMITWEGDFVHHAVGSYNIVADVKIVGEIAKRCYTTLIRIMDTNECDERLSQEWRHACDDSSTCVNTDGGYECVCSHGSFAPMKAAFRCGGHPNTSSCCSGSTKTATRAECVASFQCEIDQCESVCAPNAADCARNLVDRGSGRWEAVYSCRCPQGFVGTGRRCSQEDNVVEAFVDSRGTPTSPENLPCGCQRSVKDRCLDVACGERAKCIDDGNEVRCACNEGFKHIDQSVGCVDETLPVLQLNGPAVVEFDQCSAPYEELGVLIVDENAAAYARTLSIHYSEPLDFPSRDRGGGTRDKTPYFKIGTYNVAYRIDTPWTYPPFVEAKRVVKVVDLNECSSKSACAHQCVDAAKCVNLIDGYSCKCSRGTIGDGFANKVSYWDSGGWRKPRGYVNASGCLDIENPSLTLWGQNPIEIRIERCRRERLPALIASSTMHVPDVFRDISDEIAELIRSSPEALCDRPDAGRCATATDFDAVSGQSIVLPPESIILGLPRQKRTRITSAGSLEYFFAVPYSVADAAGNVAIAEREIVVRELSLTDFEAELQASTLKAADMKPKTPVCKPCPLCTTIREVDTETNDSASCHNKYVKHPSQAIASMREFCTNSSVRSLLDSLQNAEKRALTFGLLASAAASFAIIAIFIAANTKLALATLNGRMNLEQHLHPNVQGIPSSNGESDTHSMHSPFQSPYDKHVSIQ